MSLRGQVKWFDPKKGFGFIYGPDGQDVFVHYTQINGDGFRSLRDGEEVEYDIVEGDKGFQAQSVSRLAAADAGGSDDATASSGYQNSRTGRATEPANTDE